MKCEPLSVDRPSEIAEEIIEKDLRLTVPWACEGNNAAEVCRAYLRLRDLAINEVQTFKHDNCTCDLCKWWLEETDEEK